MERVRNTIENSENREQIRQDALFIPLFLEKMKQSRVIRWREAGEATFMNPSEVAEMRESVAEHAGSMSDLAVNVLSKARTERDVAFNDFDVMKALHMIHTHDTEEIITGDVRVKDANHYAKEREAQQLIKDQVSTLNFADDVMAAIDEYRDKSTKEARFVKAIDELQAWFYIIHTRKFDVSNRNFDVLESIAGYAFAKEFPTLMRLMNIMLRIMRNPTLVTQGIPEMELIKNQYE